MKCRYFLVLLSLNLCLFNPSSSVPFQEVKTEVILYDDYFGLVPLPENAVELIKKFSFSPLEIEHPVEMTDDSSGNIYITDDKRKAVLKFDSSGHYLGQFGQKGISKERFALPQDILLTKDFIVVYDLKPGRVKYFDLGGDFIKSTKMYKNKIHDMAINEDGLLFLAKALSDEDSALIDVFSPEGILRYSFGELIFGHFSVYGIHPLNSRKLGFTEKGELLVAFSYFPVVRKYSQDGRLLAEYKIDNGIMEAKEKLNLKLLGRARRTKFHQAYAQAMIAIKSFEGKIYLLGNYPRLEILQINDSGKIERTYWTEYDALSKPKDFIVQRVGGQIRFYVLITEPEISVDVLVENHSEDKSQGIENVAKKPISD